jgi:UDP-N-acetylglucosamine 2-epimerase (non-hydrolysing)
MSRLRFLKPLGFPDYIALQRGAFCVLSDSGTLTEESSLLKFPAVMLREAHERPEGTDAGTLVMSGLDPARFVDSVRVVTEQASTVENSAAAPATVPDYLVDDVSRKVTRIILSYTGYVNRTVWRR